MLAPLCAEKTSLRPQNPEASVGQVAAHLKQMVDAAIKAVEGAPDISSVAGPQDPEHMFYALFVAALRTLAAAALKARAARDAAAKWAAAANAEAKALREFMAHYKAEARAARSLRAARRVARDAVDEGSALEPRRVGPSRGALQDQAHHRRAKQQRRTLNLKRGKPET